MLDRPDDEHVTRNETEARNLRTTSLNAASRVAVIGGGIAGLSCARLLADHGKCVVIFDKGRGPGGRCSTRRIGDGTEALYFDHGAPLFHARDPQFLRSVAMWHEQSVAAPWNCRTRVVDASGCWSDCTQQQWTGTPGMNAIVRRLAVGLDVRFGVRMTRIASGREGHDLTDFQGRRHGPFDALIVAVPAPQAAELLAEHFGELAEQCRAISFAPQLVAIVQGSDDESEAVEWDILEDRSDTPLSLAVAAHRKPGTGRNDVPSWTLRGDIRWSQKMLEQDPDYSVVQLARSFSDRVRQHVRVLASHRWRWARCVQYLDEPCLYDEAHHVGICGDGFAAGDVEGAWLSGQAMARRLLAARGSLPSGYPLAR